MHVVLHMTAGCNMNCSYCYSPPVDGRNMTEETAKKTVDFINKNFPNNTGIIFFGGEPLLRKELIFETMRYARSVNPFFHYKVTTNGLLLDEEFLVRARESRLDVALSLDGCREAHDAHRLTRGGEPTFDAVFEKLRLLLKYQPYAKILTTISPDTVKYYAESFEFLLASGVRYMIVSLDYSADWTDEDIKELKSQYKRLARLYEKYITREKKFYFSPFDMKFTNHIREENSECYRCHLGLKQISVAFDGGIYPCTQFVQDGVSNKAFQIGDVFDGFDEAKRGELYRMSREENPACKECAYDNRCNNKCSCLNWQLTRRINELSPKICETERALIPIADKLGETLYRKRVPMFIQKHYNTVYPILSLIEDNSVRERFEGRDSRQEVINLYI